MTCTGGGAGGAGAELFYVFYSSGEPYSMTGGNSPSLTINGEKRFWTNPGAAGGAARATSGASCSCAAGAAGTAGTQSIPSNTTNLDGLNSAGIKLMKILPALLGGYIIAKWG
jgi:hypothetical protein